VIRLDPLFRALWYQWRIGWRAAIALSVSIGALGLGALPADAASLQSVELQILGKALTFMEPPLTSRSIVAIVYSPGDPESRRDAEAMASFISKIPLGGVSLTARVIDADALAAADFQLIIIATGADWKPVIAAAVARRALCVTADVDAVLGGRCTLAIRVSQKVEIFVNRAVVQQAGVSFATAFRMMVHEQ
jgi:hypothetical protein